MSLDTRSAVAALAVALLAACDPPPPPPAQQAPQAPEAAPAPDIAPVTAPAQFRVRIETSRGPLVLEVHRDWSPHGVDRFFQLVESGFYDNTRFFRVLPGFVAQVGMSGDPVTQAAWDARQIPDDPVVQGNRRGTVTFAKSSLPNSRATQIFINLVDNTSLDGMGFSAFAEVVEGMSVVDALYGGYGEGRPQGEGPSQGRIAAEGNAYLEREFPRLDYIRTARVVK